ncbi:hypothetical protein D9758_014503 [Tetrapyrgos nigripes]|uniref:NAD(P)-binding protein n=1 Tax=Tetrapyrgos nigripes TaxID=182062 RepID=A0A8H5CT50_9AGAR|nr:hypothetical protein D9758_014503 [Tetrapyrgos nigripes]
MMGPTPSKDFNPIRDLPDMKGKVVVVTGSSSGIGFAILQHLCRLGAKVYMTARSETRATSAMERLEKEGKEPGNGEVLWHQLDLVDPRKAKESAEKFMEKEQKLDILINNAGLIADRGKANVNPDGLQDTMAVNYLGTYVFTQTLLPLLEKTAETGADVRLINVGSNAHEEVTFTDFSTVEAWNHTFRWSLLPTFSRYKYSKLALHTWSNYLARRLTDKNSKVLLIVAHPGPIMSDGALSNLRSLPVPKFWVWLLSLWLYPQEMGGYAPAYAACAPRADALPNPAPNETETLAPKSKDCFKPNAHIVHGTYIVPPNINAEQGAAARDVEKQKALEACTRSFLEKIGLDVPAV